VTTACLRATGLGKRYGERWAMRDLSLELFPGEFVAVIGANGAGKTTLLTTLAGVTRPTTGKVETDGGRVGWVPQQRAVYGRLSVAENLRFFARLERLDDIDRAVDEMLGLTGLRERAGDSVNTLSGGNQQRVNVAVGLLGDPAVVVLDEPTAGVDAPQRERLWELLRGRCQAGGAILTSTHQVTDAGHHASRVLVLNEGQIVFLGTPEEFVARIVASSEIQASEALPDFQTAFADYLRHLADGPNGGGA
jgi:ABC-2 type transport system ATP-binding protein